MSEKVAELHLEMSGEAGVRIVRPFGEWKPLGVKFVFALLPSSADAVAVTARDTAGNILEEQHLGPFGSSVQQEKCRCAGTFLLI